MKSRICILSVAVLTVIYCFAIGAVNYTFSRTDFTTNSVSSQEKVISDFSTKLFCLTSNSERTITNLNTLPLPPNFDHQFRGSKAIFKTKEQEIVSTFTHYTIFSRNLLTNSKKIDLISPFQYFW